MRVVVVGLGYVGSVCSACLADLGHILHHRLAMFAEMGFRDPAVLERVETVSREYFTVALPTRAYLGWLAEDENGQVVGGGGIVVADWPGYPSQDHAKRAWILNMYTEPEARRRGVARNLLQAMIGWCRSQGYAAVSLHASAAGRPLYESLGFQQTNELSLKLN